MTDLLPALTEIVTTRDIVTPDGILPAGSRGTIVTTYDHGGFYGVEFAAPFHIAWLTRGDLLPIECD
jgi:hypothetical protein